MFFSVFFCVCHVQQMFFIVAVFSDMCNHMWSYRISKLLAAAEDAFTEDTQKLSFFNVFCMHLSYQKDKKTCGK